jgi:hypothetical protein
VLSTSITKRARSVKTVARGALGFTGGCARRSVGRQRDPGVLCLDKEEGPEPPEAYRMLEYQKALAVVGIVDRDAEVRTWRCTGRRC